jgi:tetratricopeptide (TPR) repeat protein
LILSRLLLLVLLVGLAPVGRADVVVLRNGSRLGFPSCEDEADRVVCRTDAGTVSFARAHVLQVLRGESEEAAAPTWRADGDDGDSAAAAGPGVAPGALELTLEGFRREQLGEWDEAEAAYRDALGRRPAPATARVGLARVLPRQGRHDEAIDELQTLLVDRPEEAGAHRLLGEALDAADRLEDAVRAWERAAALDPSHTERYREGLRELETQRDYHRALAPHFTVSYDGERDEELGGAILEALEDAFDEFVTRLEHYPENTILVILYSRRDFEEVTGAGSDVGGLFDGKVRLPVGGIRRLTSRVVRVARHELVHAFLHDKGRGHVPRWLHEGLAQRLEGRQPESRGALLRSLEASGDAAAWATEFSYPKALSLVAYLEEEYGEGRLLDLVAALGETGSETLAFDRVFGVEPDRIRREWTAWLGWDRS